MKKVLFFSLILAVAAFMIMGLKARTEMPGPDAEALWDYITQESPYNEWGFWADHQGIQSGNSPHGPFHRVYVNEVLLNASSVPVPYGSIQVKESFDANKNKTNITVMYKIEGYNAQAGDWYWARYTLEGKPGPVGKVQGCIGCHGVKAANDYITVHTIK